jgi:hypothetical protein
MYTFEELKKKSVVQLKIELSKIGATSRGRKIELVERLIAYSRNFNFSEPPIILPRAKLVPLWPSQGFKSLTSNDSKQGLVLFMN